SLLTASSCGPLVSTIWRPGKALPGDSRAPARCGARDRSLPFGHRAKVIYPGHVDRQPPRATSDEIALYIRTYYSLLRSSGDVRARASAQAHLPSRSSLHLGAEDPEPDLAAFASSAARLPECMSRIRRIVLGQSQHQFDHAGFPVDRWQIVRTRGRRRPLRWN